MILSGSEIKKHVKLCTIRITPFSARNVQPNSYDVRLGNRLLRYSTNDALHCFNSQNEPVPEEIIIPKKGYILEPGYMYLGVTYEEVGSDNFIPMLEGRSSMGRAGCFIHFTAGFGDVGFHGKWTLEIYPLFHIKVFPKMRIGQVYFNEVCGDTTQKYRSRYAKQDKPVASQIYERN